MQLELLEDIISKLYNINSVQYFFFFFMIQLSQQYSAWLLEKL